MKFKYKVVDMSGKNIQGELNKLGSKGWELSHVCQNTKYIFIKDITYEEDTNTDFYRHLD